MCCLPTGTAGGCDTRRSRSVVAMNVISFPANAKVLVTIQFFPFKVSTKPTILFYFCRVHHKMVDDQPQTYTVERLRKLKADHEAWVASKLSPEHAANQPRARLRRVKAEIPEYLLRLTSGAEVFKIMQGACGFSFDHDEPESEKETELVASFLQEAQDWGDFSGDLEAGEQVRAAFRISTLVDELERAGFSIFGARETQRLEVGLVLRQHGR